MPLKIGQLTSKYQLPIVYKIRLIYGTTFAINDYLSC